MRMKRLKNQLSQDLPNIDIQPFFNAFSERLEVKKGELLVKEGEKAHYLAFVNKGSFRIFEVR